jgi:hypothetical protein
MDAGLWRQYRTDCWLEAGGKRFQDDPDNYYTDDDKEPPAPPPVVNEFKIPTINDLPADHFAAQYVNSRKIPKKQWHRLYYASVFSEAVREIIPDYFKVERHKKLLRSKEPRLVLPYYDREKKLLGITGRAFDSNGKRYIVCKVADDSLKIYGLDCIDVSYPVFVLEGQIDSLFLPNAIAIMDGSLHSFDPLFAGLGIIHRIVVPDNQPRNKEVVASVRKAIEQGESVVLWPNGIESKDINEMITDEGYTVSEVMHTIERRTFKGLSAKLEFNNWQKIN